MDNLDNDKFIDICNSIRDKISPQQFDFFVNYSEQSLSLKIINNEYCDEINQLNNHIKNFKNIVTLNQEIMDKKYEYLQKRYEEYSRKYTKVVDMYNNSDTYHIQSLSKKREKIALLKDSISAKDLQLIFKYREKRALEDQLRQKSYDISCLKSKLLEKTSRADELALELKTNDQLISHLLDGKDIAIKDIYSGREITIRNTA